MFSGLAVGGPLDGKSISFESPLYRVPEVTKIEPFLSFKAEIESAIVVDVFTYVHIDTPGGGVWVPKPVKDGERYDHKIWGHPFDFVFSKLIRNYRPDGY